MKPLRILSRVSAGIVVALALGFLGLLVVPRGGAEAFPEEGWTPLRDDGLARAHLPGLRSGAAFGSPVAALYRAARAADGSVYIGYHFAWEREENPAPGLGPALSRAIYTGGLSLQRLMFGKGDVELVVVELGPDGAERACSFEEALDYDPASFSVTHAPARRPLAPGERALLEVMSWNHLFRALPAGSAVDADPPLAYFEDADWKAYGMHKARPTFLRRDRALAPWELRAAR